MTDRRDFCRLALGGLAAAVGPAHPASAGRAEPATVEIGMGGSADGSRVWFDPVGLLVPPGTLVRWRIEGNVHTATAYHPANGGRSRRIPEAAEPWDSGYLVEPGDSFAVRLEQPGVYDYFCAPHEQAGMVGRLVVGTATGPGALPFDYFLSLRPPPDWMPVPPAARRSFPPVDRILRDGLVRAPT